ncbi:LIC_10705 family lipoprotein [Leptospira interrogans]|uniref:Lipoprotein n=5 Tax=Leptospira interrogans TaxID=173 RepID=Q72UF1_LEPIC|nr:LIC_10705 family lipoprotein [Leptospira interrogans]APH40682.1 Uncharacterized protein A9P81_0765 [Leptospira interrogans serovar Copenhageni/Icterohaemorrhagiae]OCC27364.1 Uncharacterized protein GNX_4138 [Leptospira interrogans serovar Canicola]AAS69327.1 conserved hypothetical protein [Leptospira interrogans serovar Copenhageni str. Fiocruz L1-130]ARB96746.1 hypothetical protein A6J42_15680 [Leptospira interrogans serovar Copenhageni]ASP41614.1 hypothetical protein AMR47_06200 [Leptospi
MLKKILYLILISYLNLYCDYLQGTSTSDYHNEFMLEYSVFFILPNLDFNQYCPPTEEIPILEPGTYTRYMSEGDTYIFDNRARFQQSAPSGERRYFTFTIQENPGQEMKLTTPECGNSSDEFKADDDSGLPGQFETLSIALLTPPLPVKRFRFFTKLKAVTGSGIITFTTPSAPDPPQ